MNFLMNQYDLQVKLELPDNFYSKSLWRWYIGTNIMFLDTIHRPVFI
jgi:hypothetical protein